MTDIRQPRKGSLAYRPRKRADKQMPTIRSWTKLDQNDVLGFAGYKCGMTTINYISEDQLTKGMEVAAGATIIETPPMYVYGYRVYNNGNSYDYFTDDNKVLKNLKAKKFENSFKEDEMKNFEDLRLLCFTKPDESAFGKKKVERMEIGIGGSLEEKMKKAKELLGKQIRNKDIFKEGMLVDVTSITKGKGWQGPVKRFGVKIQRRKATGKRRHVGVLGAFKPGYVMSGTPAAGQTGYHRRTEKNKLVLKVGTAEEIEKINPVSGFVHYGFIKSDFIVVKGSIPGSVKRLIRINRSYEKPNANKTVNIVKISKAAKN